MQTSHLLLVASLTLAACGAPPNGDARDPHAPALAPAVIVVPSPLTAPSAKADTATSHKSTVIPDDENQRVAAVSQGYSLATAAMITQGARMLATLYAADARLTLPDTSVTGVAAIAQRWTALAKAKSLADFQRTSKGMRLVDDSTLADSGAYMMILKRTPKDSVIERGRYATTWRARAGGSGNWVILDDRVTPDAKQGRK